MLMNYNTANIDFNKNGFDFLGEVEQRNLKKSCGLLMGLQLREIIENSFNEFTTFFLDVPRIGLLKKRFEGDVERLILAEEEKERA